MDTRAMNSPQDTFEAVIKPLLNQAQRLLGTTVAVDVPRTCKRRLTTKTDKVTISQ